MDLTFVLCPNVLGILALTLLLTFTRFNFYLDKKRLKLFITAAIINVVIIVIEVADYLLGQADFETAYLFRRITSATGFALTPIIPILITNIAVKERLSYWFMLPAAVNIIMSYTSIFTGHMFYIGPGNSYERGPLFIAMAIISAFYLLLLIYKSFRNFKQVHSSESTFLIGIAVIMILGNLLEILFAFHFVIWNSCAVLLICYYLYLHIQYFKYDPLTNVYNRSMFNFDIENLNSNSRICVFSFDLNGLKKINDTEGHEKGDEYIITSAKVIGSCFANIGKLYRIGGDEFVVVSANISESDAIVRVQEFFEECKKFDISVACGYAYKDNIIDISQILRDADNSMYENKRNRVINN